MSILTSYHTNKAIATILADQSSMSGENKQAYLKLKKIGPAAIPKLIEALASSQDTQVIETLLQGFVDNNTISIFIASMDTTNQKIVKSLVKVLSHSTNFNPNRLVEVLSQEHASKSAAFEILSKHADRVEIKPLISMLDKVAPTTRPFLYRLIDMVVTPQSTPLLINKTGSKDPMVRTFLATVISRFDTAQTHHALANMLNDPNKNVRQAALQGLSTLRSTGSVELICQSLRDPDLTVQTAAIDALIQINAPNTIKYLIDVLEDKSEYVRRAAVEILNEIGDHRAIEDLLNALRDADWWVKVRAADALGFIGGPKVTEAALTLIKDEDKFMRRTAVEILNNNQDENAFDRLIDALKDEDWWVRERAVDALAAIGDKRAVQPLLKMLDDAPKASQVIIRALAKLGDETAIRPIISKLDMEDRGTSKEAITALRHITTKRHVDEVQQALSHIIEQPEGDLNDDALETMKTLVAKYGDRSTLHNTPDIDVDVSDTPPARETQEDSESSPSERKEANVEMIDASLLNPGDIFQERYKVIKQVGKGAFGVVVLVEDLIVNDQFILKFLNPHVAMDNNMIQRFTHELRYARKITHENVIRIYDFITHKNAYAISMEYFPSHSLAHELKNKQPQDIRRGIRIVQQICAGMSAAQTAHVVHRDLKPGNILINDDDLVKIVDFGLAAAASSFDSRLTKTGILVGTPTYMAPEQIRGKAIDARTDIYSLGIIMYEMFTGKAPYAGDEPIGVMYQHIEGRCKSANTLNPEIPDSLQQIISKAMSIDAEDRFQTFSEFRNALTALQEELL